MGLKQERMEVFQEARDRQVKLWEVNDLNFSESYGGKVRVVRSEESWVEAKVVGGKKTRQPQNSHWWWMVSEGLRSYPCKSSMKADTGGGGSRTNRSMS